MSIKKEWLICTKTPEEFVNEELERKAILFKLSVDKAIKKFGTCPFGNRWQEFVKKMQLGDELWKYSTPQKMILNKMDSIGYAIVRNGKIVDHFVRVRT